MWQHAKNQTVVSWKKGSNIYDWMDTESDINICAKKKEVRKNITMINIAGEKMCPYATTTLKNLSIYSFINITTSKYQQKT